MDLVAQLSQQGYKALKSGDLTGAEQAFNEILLHNAENTYALVGLGDTMIKLKKYDDAERYYHTCLEHDPNNRFAIYGIADIYRLRQNYDQAIEYWKLYLQFDAENCSVLSRLADACRKTERSKEAEKYYLAVLLIDETHVYAHIGLGHLYYHNHQYERAIDVWHHSFKSLTRRPSVQLLTSIGNAYYKLHKFTEALKYFEMAAEQDSENMYVLFGLAHSYRGLGMVEDSIKYLEKILELDPSHTLIKSRLGDALVKIGRYERAEKVFLEIQQQNFDPFAALGLARLYILRKEYSKAIDLLAELLPNPKVASRVKKFLQELQTDNNMSADEHEALKVVLAQS